MDSPFVITRIPFRFTRLIDEKGVFYPSVNVYEAKANAERIGLQLVCFSMPNDKELPLCKIIDFGKWKYQNEKGQKKTKQTHSQVHELYFTPNIESHDIEHKLKKVKEFIEGGDEVLLVLKVSGRDLAHMDLAHAKMDQIVQQCIDFSSVESRKAAGKLIFVKLTKRKAEKKTEFKQKQEA